MQLTRQLLASQGYTDVMTMNERGELRGRLQGCSERAGEDCRTCGGDGFILCTWCQGKPEWRG